MWIREAARRLLALAATVVLAGFLGGMLVWLAPGFGVDERELDARLSSKSIESLRQEPAPERDLAGYYFGYLKRMLAGDLGISRLFDRPVAELLRERVPVTLRLIGVGLAAGWLIGLGLALPNALWRIPAFDFGAGVASGFFLCLPSAVLALLLLLAGGPPRLALALVLFPRIFRYSRNLLVEAGRLPHVLIARSAGIGRGRILWFHILPGAAPQLVALAGVSVSLAIGAAIPVEVVSDLPGIGQLAWKAALGRDLPLLISLTVIITLVTVVANAISDAAAGVSARGREGAGMTVPGRRAR